MSILSVLRLSTCLRFLCAARLLLSLYLHMFIVGLLLLCAHKRTPRFRFNKMRKHWIYRQKAARQHKNQCKFWIIVPVDVQITRSLTTGRFSVEPIFSWFWTTWKGQILYFMLFSAPLISSSSKLLAEVKARSHVRILSFKTTYSNRIMHLQALQRKLFFF